jgi:hypothetical protein
MVSRKWDFLVWAIFVLYCAGFISLNFSVYPPGNGRDELDHLKLIEFYGQEKRFPKLPEDWISPQAHQPPLYYILMAAFSKLALPPTESTRYERNPFFLAENYNPALSYYNRVLYVQPRQGAPYAFSFRVLRGVSLLLHGFGLLFVWRAIRLLFREEFGRIVAPLALSFLALAPSFWRVALAVSNNALLFPLGAAAFWLLARGLRRGWTIRSAAVLGVVLGLGLLTKLYFLPLVATTLIVMGMARFEGRRGLKGLSDNSCKWLIYFEICGTPGRGRNILRPYKRDRSPIVGTQYIVSIGKIDHKPNFCRHFIGQALKHPAKEGGSPLKGADTGLFAQVYGTQRGASGLARWPAIFVVLVVCALVAGGWYARNFALYGDFGAIKISEEEQGSRRETPPTFRETAEILAYWPGQLWAESWVVLNTRSILNISSGLGWGVLISGLIGLRRMQRLMIPGGASLLLAGFFPALGFAVVGAVRNRHATYTPPLMIVGLPALSVLFACGILVWVYWADAINRVPTLASEDFVSAPFRGLLGFSLAGCFSFRRGAGAPSHRDFRWSPCAPTKRITLTGIFLILVGSVAYTGAIFAPQFPAFDPLENGEAIPNPVWVRFENGARLLGYELEDTVLHPGDLTRVQLCWESATPIQKDYAFSVQLVLPGHPKAALQDGYPLSGRYPTHVWEVPFCEWVPLRISEDAVTPRAYPLRVSMYEVGGYDVPYVSENGQRSTILLLDRVTIIEEPPEELPTVRAQVEDWGGLRNYEGIFQDDSFLLRLDWLALGPSPTPYHYFLHARAAEGNILAQLDRPPLYNNFPTDTWVRGAEFSEVLHLELPPGTVEVFFGMYDPISLRRGSWVVNGEQIGDGLLFPSPGVN